MSLTDRLSATVSGACEQPPAGQRRVRSLALRAVVGQRTACAQPSFSKAQMTRADMSIWPRPMPWRAQVGSAWCRLCHSRGQHRLLSGGAVSTSVTPPPGKTSNPRRTNDRHL